MFSRAMKSRLHLFVVFSVLLAWTGPAKAEDEISEMLEVLTQQIEAAPNNPDLLLQRARMFMVAKKYDQAMADLNFAARLKPSAELQREKARVLIEGGWSEDGLKQANTYIAANPNDSDAYALRARLNSKLGKIDEANRDYSLALQNSREPALDLYFEQARMLNQAGGAYLKDALTTINDGIQRIGPVITLEQAALELEQRQGSYDAALKRLDGVIQRMPLKDTFMAQRGDILAQAGRYDEAKTAYQGALDEIGKLPPFKKNLPAKQELEKQLRVVADKNTDLRGRPPVFASTGLLNADAKPAVSAVAPMIATVPALLPGGKVRTYYVAAEEVDWNYAPRTNVLQEPFCGDLDSIVRNDMTGRIGSIYRKAIFREYTDGTYTKLMERPAAWQHLGMLGPLLRAQVGDRLKVVLLNRTRHPVSMHPHGVFYTKANEGSGYEDQTGLAEKKDDVVHSGATYTYEWFVPESAGPGPNDPSSIPWLYHSHVHASKDSNAGLIGAIIVTAKGKAKPNGTPIDVDREFVTLFNIYDENLSWFFTENVRSSLGTNYVVNRNDFLFQESNKKHAINGYLFGNVPMMVMNKGERVRWYLLGMGGETDLHTAHWHGNTALFQGHRTDVVELLPASMKVADMVPENPGIWMYHCHVNDHMMEGMSARYQVLGK
jgi:tetratricopeptide (TPR) repeat protein